MRGSMPLLVVQAFIILDALNPSTRNEVSATPLVLAASVQNVTLQNTNSDLVYIPRFCANGNVCEGGWTVVDLPGSSNGSVTSTNGPSIQTGNILPQVFLTFRGSALYVKTSEISNATANLTVSSVPSGTLESRVFAPSRDFWAFEGLDETQLTTVAVTYLSEPVEDASGQEDVARLDIDFIKISVSNASASSSFLPSQTIPTSAFTPSLAAPTTPHFTSTITSSSLNHQPVGAIVGETLAGCVTVLLAVSLAVFLIRRRYHRRRDGQRQKEANALQAAQQVFVARGV